ncbi:hypothetical protein N7486_010122 [Penicillium sp. IBT 16267x]|nr:hypothetical protein N7486_010122 [Penicillium sp. IBT 16267x]
MAPISKTLALAGALFAMAGVAAPVQKRAVVWETVTDIVWTTVDVTTTVYPQEFVATATVVPVTTSAAAEVTTPTEKPTPEEYRQAQTTSTSTSSTSTLAPAPVTTEQPTTVAAAVVEPTTSAAPVVEPTTSAAPVVEPTAAAEPTSTSTAAAVATSVSSSSSGYSGSCAEGSPCTGQMTYYDTATSASNPSACGTTNDGLTELVLALPVGIMTDSDCGKTVTISYNGVTQTGTVVDKCMGCDDTSVDLSRAFFEAFDPLSVGRISGATWYIN